MTLHMKTIHTLKFLFLFSLSAIMLGGCDREDTPELFDKVTTSTPNNFLQYPNMQPSLAAGTYTIVAATVNSGSSDSFTLTITKDDGSSTQKISRWISSGGISALSPENPRFDFTLDTAGGINISLESGVDNYLILLDRSENILFEDDNSGTSGNALLNLPESRINNKEWTDAYYAAIDPGNERDTLNKWKTKNGFDQGHDVHVIFRDTKDLGYGRNMFMRRNANGCLAFYVENFLVTLVDGLDYNTLNLTAAIEDDQLHHFGTNAIEFSDLDGDCDGTDPMFNKFFTFDATASAEDEPRILSVNLDNRGKKFMPIPCITCHGGTAKPLLADGSLPSSALPDQLNPELLIGDTVSRLQPFEVDTFEYSNKTGFSRAEQEDKLKELNEAVFSTLSATRADGDWDADFLREVMDGWYDGHFLTASNNQGFNDTFIPQGWRYDPTDASIPATRPASSEELYLKVYKPFCFSCHSKRGTTLGSNINNSNGVAPNDNNQDINFSSYEKFTSHIVQIEDYVFARGIMPMSRLTFDKFWEGDAAEILASHIPGFKYANADGSINIPGKPVANAGLDRTVISPVNLSAETTFFADTYSWEIIQQPDSSIATIAEPSSLRTSLSADTNGLYTIQLNVSNTAGEISTDTVDITIDNTLSPSQTEITFDTDILNLLQGGTTISCLDCHNSTLGIAGIPVYYDTDSNGYTLYENIIQRINFSDPAFSPLLRKPFGEHHFGEIPITDPANYNMIVNWVLEGAREN
ncbi:MAG: hypothetical protein DIZ80_12010 [endosymbiont of Galathealinum brachiosum]|uniref:Cytochrome c domain-containing protein n=1 Tax=endosymbiont of Galathealinum brachiosum TaxID=2200906 RepID=A0A370DDL7_9GAMM|nr:MAG: hypothetical protein DIZ80_12010 [endosymbiont of Galathealinum brachiosum]